MSTRARRRVRVSIGIAALTAVGMTGALALHAPNSDAAGETDDTVTDGENSTATAVAEKRDLVERVEVDGTLGYGASPPVRGHRNGTLTSTHEPGSVLDRGSIAFTIDGRPIPLLYGQIPMWRRLDIGAEGVDVAQLEENLVAMGYATEAQLRGDGEYDARTATAVKKWQKDLGVDQTGAVDLGELEYVAGPVRVAKNAVAVGDQVGPGATVLEVTETTREITMELEASRQSLIAEGAAVIVALPDGSSAAGTIKEVGRVAEADDEDGAPGSGTPMISVTVTLDDVNAGGSLDSAPVTVQLTKSTAEDVLAVPVRSLLALAEGGYAVEVVDNGIRSLVGVELGTYADGWVEVQGNLRDGDEVVTAS